MVKLLREYRSVLIAVFIIITLVIISFITYKKLAEISSKISSSFQNTVPASFVAKQILIETRSAENNVRSFHLSQSPYNINAFYKSANNIELLIHDLLAYKKINPEDGLFIDSIKLYSHIELECFKSQLYLNNSEELVSTVDKLNQKIDSIYQQDQAPVPTNKEQNEVSQKQKQGFLKRLFLKNKSTKDTVSVIKPVDEKQKEVNNVKKKIKREVITLKSTQAELIEESKKNELLLNNSIFIYREKLNVFIDSLKRNEEKRIILKTLNANKELQKLQYFSLASSLFLGFILLTLIYFIIGYINRKKQYEEMLLEAKFHAENLATAKEMFLANMSHEIKTPLNAIYGFSEVLLDGKLNPDQEKHVSIIKNSASYLTKLVNNILTYARYNSGKVKLCTTTVNLNHELSEIQQTFSYQATAKGLQLLVNTSDLKYAFVKTDIDKLKQILYNLISNALKFTDKGKVEIQVSNSDLDDTLIFKIIDTGIGIDEKILPNLFHEFEQGDENTNSKFGGTGLGLVITKKIIEELQGQIWIESELNKGTVVSFNMPVEFDKENSVSMPSDIKATDFSMIENKTILVVDDEEYNRLLVKTILHKKKAKITEASNGKEALEKFKEQKFDLIIMDARMPVMNGIEATKEIRKTNKDIYILGATAVMEDEKITRCKHAGMNDIIFKPFSTQELLLKLKSIFNHETISELYEKELHHAANYFPDASLNIHAIDETTDGDEQLKKELITVFYNSINTTYKKIEEHYLKEDYHTISELAHKIIPSCKHFEAMKAIAYLKYLENLRHQADINKKELRTQLNKLHMEVENMNIVLKEFLS